MPELLLFLLYIAIYGFLVYLITKIPMVAPFRKVIVGIAVIALVVWVIALFSGKTTMPPLVWPFH